jgi:8-oxo-dGTP diphosphatase
MVVGFAFEGNNVLLIRKMRPTWQAGKYNGVGGKLRNQEEPSVGMQREFQEETGLYIQEANWVKPATMIGPNWNVTVYGVFANIGEAVATTDEEPMVFSVNNLPRGSMIDNLEWLVPLTLQKLKRGEPESVTIYYQK